MERIRTDRFEHLPTGNFREALDKLIGSGEKVDGVVRFSSQPAISFEIVDRCKDNDTEIQPTVIHFDNPDVTIRYELGLWSWIKVKCKMLKNTVHNSILRLGHLIKKEGE